MAAVQDLLSRQPNKLSNVMHITTKKIENVSHHQKHALVESTYSLVVNCTMEYIEP